MTEIALDYGKTTIKMVATTDRTGTQNELDVAIDTNREILNYNAGPKIPVSRLTEPVPEGLDNSTKPVMVEETYPIIVLNEETGEEEESTATRLVRALDGEGNPISEQKTWEEFAITYPATDGEVLLLAKRYVNASKCHSVISSEELYIWIAALGKTNFLIKESFDSFKFVPESEGL